MSLLNFQRQSKLNDWIFLTFFIHQTFQYDKWAQGFRKMSCKWKFVFFFLEGDIMLLAVMNYKSNNYCVSLRNDKIMRWCLCSSLCHANLVKWHTGWYLTMLESKDLKSDRGVTMPHNHRILMFPVIIQHHLSWHCCFKECNYKW